MRTRLGGYAWSEATNGKLTGPEKLKVVSLLVCAKVMEGFGRAAMAMGAGCNRLAHLDPRSIVVPDTQAAQQSFDEAAKLYTPALLNHCLRTYYFAALFAQFHGVKPDHELLYVACIMHDLGLIEANEADMETTGFQIIGARKAREFGAAIGWDLERNRRVYEAVSLHLNPFIPLEATHPEAALLQRAATLDVIGMNRHRLTPYVIRGVDARFPRTGFREEILHTITEKPHMPCSHANLLGKCGFAKLARSNPLDQAPYVASAAERYVGYR